MTLVWIDTTSGTWGTVENSQGRLVLVNVDDETLEMLDHASDDAIAEYGIVHGVVPHLH